MANVYDPRPQHLSVSASSKSSSSSENDIMDDVFLHPGKGAPSNRFGFPLSKKNRTASDPTTAMMGKEMNRDKAQALSDSSNLVKRSEETGPGKLTTSSSYDKLKTSPVTDGSDGFPEPESIRREATKDTHFLVLFEEEEETNEEMGANSLPFPANTSNGSPQYMEDLFDNEDPFDYGSTSTFGNLAFEMGNRNNGTVNAPQEGLGANHPSTEDEDDSMFPEIEHFPKGYRCSAYDEVDLTCMYPPMDEPKIVLRSFHGDSDFPELPDDLIKENITYPELDLPEVEVPELPALKLWSSCR